MKKLFIFALFACSLAVSGCGVISKGDCDCPKFGKGNASAAGEVMASGEEVE